MAASGERMSCGAVLVRQDDGHWRTLLLRAWSNWDFAKGLREAGEQPIETAVREVGEETGIHDLHFDWGEVFIDTGPYNRGKVARYYLLRAGTERVQMGISPELGRPEHHEYRWFSFDQAWDIAPPRVRAVVAWARQIVNA